MQVVGTASQDNTARIWEAVTGKSVTELRGHSDPVNSAPHRTDGQFVVTASWDKDGSGGEVSTGMRVANLRDTVVL